MLGGDVAQWLFVYFCRCIMRRRS